jgi:uncharacterized protein YjbJ (UPF0337 family)
MSITDKISGRVKQAAGDLTGNRELHREGLQEERKGEAKEEQVRAEEQAERADATARRRAAEVDALERKTSRDGVAPRE